MPSPFILEAINVHKAYANHKALNDVTIQVPQQSVFGLLGPNGAGKTTLIRIINQITGPDQGKILFNGEPLSPKHIGTIGYLPEERGLYKKMKVGEQAVYLARLKGLSKSESIEALKEWFVKFEIEGWWDKKVEELSKGMQQKVQFITTILHKPKLLIFDEPFSGFDPINVNLLKSEILNLRDQGSTVIFSTHNMSSVEELCDNIALINRSEVILQGAISEIRHAQKDSRFRIEYSAQLPISKGFPGLGTIIEEKDLHGGHFETILRAPSDLSANALVSQLITGVEIQKFEQILPSMNDIFIQTVNQSNYEK